MYLPGAWRFASPATGGSGTSRNDLEPPRYQQRIPSKQDGRLAAELGELAGRVGTQHPEYIRKHVALYGVPPAKPPTEADPQKLPKFYRTPGYND